MQVSTENQKNLICKKKKNIKPSVKINKLSKKIGKGQ